MPCPEILVIVGPTASGKSALAVELARQRNGEVISADSRQVYKGLDIGTGKIRKRERKGVRHHLLDVASPKKIFTAHDFVRLGRIAIKDIHARGKLPIICGGTGFYIDALIGRTSLSEIERNDVLRKRHADKTAAQLYALLQEHHL
jgi:tRNA dimethylallyltransferase